MRNDICILVLNYASGAEIKKKELQVFCPYFSICRGGCQRNRDLDMASGLYVNYFCESYKMFFDACLPLMKEVAAAAQ